MTAPIPLRLDPADYPPPHGPDSCLCDACHRLRREQGHRPLETDSRDDQSAYWNREADACAALGWDDLARRWRLLAAVFERETPAPRWEMTP